MKAKGRSAPHLDIKRIDDFRARLDLPHKELCARAGVKTQTWERLRSGVQQPRRRTIERLDQALEDEIEALRLATPGRPVELVEITQAFELAMKVSIEGLGGSRVFRRERFRPEDITAADRQVHQQGRALSLYLLNKKLTMRPGTIARAIGMSQPGVQKAITRVEQTYDPSWLDALGERFLKAYRRSARKGAKS